MIEVAIQRGAADADRVGDLLHGVLTTGEHVAGDAQLFVGDDCPATAEPTTSARRLQARLRALVDQLALKLGDRAEYVEHQPPGGSRGVDALGQAAKPDRPALRARRSTRSDAEASGRGDPGARHTTMVPSPSRSSSSARLSFGRSVSDRDAGSLNHRAQPGALSVSSCSERSCSPVETRA